MLNETGIRIFEIPIYGISENLFIKKWDKEEVHFVETSPTLIACKDVVAEKKRLRDIFRNHEKLSYKYNQIVGFLVISIDKSDVVFNLFLSDVQYRYNARKTEKLIKYIWRSGDHSYIGSLSNNSEIATRIKEHIGYEVESLKRNHKNYFLDITAFNAVIEHIDFLSIINTEGNPQ